MQRAGHRAWFRGLFVICLFLAGASAAQAATVTVGLEVVSSRDVDVEVSPGVSPFPIPLVTIAIRLDPPVGTRFDTLILQGLHPGVANPANVTIIGNVTVGTGNLAFLRGAQFLMAIGVGDTPLTFTF